MSKYKLLIVDDERDIVALLQEHFEYKGYEVLTAYDGKEAIRLAQQQPDLILLDINMPSMNGLEVCAYIRSLVSCPILFVSAKIDESDKIKGLSVGGDDYIIKPFSIHELSARVEAHLRRDERHLNKTKIKFFDHLQIDYGAKEITCEGKLISFTKKEYEIIEFLSIHRGQVFDKERMYEKLWGFDGVGDSSVISEHIRKIRAKFAISGKDQPIETVWGLGYKWKS
ncbi:MAG TPA: response regulator transcription factor [Candidatus Paenibacillus intestinavium]|nr:response regulator transcription factor [Candidatus Paenibacillus intestinavium]